MATRDEIIEELKHRGPELFMVDATGRTVSPSRALEQYGMISDIIYVLTDGRTIGTVEALKDSAEALYAETLRYVVTLPGYSLKRWRK